MFFVFIDMGMLQITLINAENLPAADRSGKLI